MARKFYHLASTIRTDVQKLSEKGVFSTYFLGKKDHVLIFFEKLRGWRVGGYGATAFLSPYFHLHLPTFWLLVVSSSEDDNEKDGNSFNQDLLRKISKDDLQSIKKQLLTVSEYYQCISETFAKAVYCCGLQDLVPCQVLQFGTLNNSPFVRISRNGNFQRLTVSTFGCEEEEIL